jgi:fructuronate reductase
VTSRLCNATLGRLPARIRRPAYDRSVVERGIVHLGPGAFHRVHQAWFAERWLERDPRWGIVGVALRSAALGAALEPQDWLYTLAILDRREAFEVIGSIVGVVVGDGAADLAACTIAGRQTRLVTLTVTEKGYCLDGAGRLDRNHPDIVHDLACPRRPRSAVGFVVEGLRQRRELGLGPVPVVSCDNLADNGRLLAAAVQDYAQELDPGLRGWIADEVPFPCTMVDSITPATTPELRSRVASETGLEDAWPVQRESFLQWVVEKHDAVSSPDWEGAGVTLTADVSAHERAKLRLLNGAHSTLAYVGLLRGHQTVGQAMADSALRDFVVEFLRRDVVPTLRHVPGLDLETYLRAVLNRFENPAMRHELAQIAWDGSKKLPVRLLGTVRDALASGAPVDRPCVTLAAWMHFVRSRAAAGVPIVDPLGEQLSELGRRRTTGEARHDVGAFLELGAVFPRELVLDARFRSALERAYSRLGRSPAALT